jgi:hypothetical protein
VKGTWLLTAALLAASVSVASADQAAFGALVKTLDPVLGYWSFDGDYKDQTGKGNDATAGGNLDLIKFVAGVNGGQGVQFKNAEEPGQYLTVKAPVGGAFDSKTLSVFIWAKIESEASDGHWDNLLDRTSLWYAETQWKEAESGELTVDFVSRIYTPLGTQSGGTDQVRTLRDGKKSTSANAWHLFGWTYDGEVIISYVDGKEVTRKEYTEGLGPNADTPPVEDSPHGDYDINWGGFNRIEDWADASVDDTLIVGRALTATEVQALYDAMLAKPAENPPPTAGSGG